NDLRGRRAIALQHSGGRVNCAIDNDMAINSVSPSSGGPFLDCGSSTSLVDIQLLNQSGTVLSNIPIFYQLDNQAIVSEVYNGSIVPNVPISHTFVTPLDLPAAGTFQIKAWTGQPLDTIPGNDTSLNEITVFPSTVLTAPFIQDFESSAPCGTSSNCGGEVCPLEDGWLNVANGDDDIDWRVDRGGTPSNGTGPFVDHLPGSSGGNYLYLEASAGCENQVAELVSPCLDLSGALAPQLVFWYHMTGDDVGTLSVDININGTWLTNFGGTLSGDQGDQWQSKTINLAGFSGQTINVRFRGTTGGGWSSDIAIDDISLFDPAGAPAAYFVADREEACVGTPITFIESSLNLPSGWEWSFTPNAVTYLNGTTATSQQPQVSFAQAGTYEVQLIASNANGGDTMIRSQYIQVTPGTGPDVVEDFESGIFPPVAWQIGNPDAQNSWESTQATGINGTTTTVAYVNNDQLEANGQEDQLIPIAINLAGATDPSLNFDVAYGQRANSSIDLLRVELSQDCGETYPVVLYEKSGAILATTSNTDLNWFPQSGNDWRTEEIDLAPFNGNTVMVRFVNRNGNGNSNNLFVDNIRVIEEGLAAPTADFNSSAVLVCEGSELSFFDQSQGQNISGYTWDFGAGAQPATAASAGPHSVAYASPGIKTITLTTTNAAGSTSISKIIEVSPLPDPNFTFDRVVATYSFTNVSVNADSFQWNFGDGTTSDLENPEHEYSLNGSYDVMLIAFNDCGPDTLVQKLEVFAVSRADLLEAGIQLFPNPTTGQVELRIDQAGSLDWEVEVTDLRGKHLFGKQLAQQVQGIQTRLNLTEYPNGVYLIHLTSGNQRWTQKLLLQR
ncbi:MAG: PKD domain-containing protein, partial [Bacteroidota bacterium]